MRMVEFARGLSFTAPGIRCANGRRCASASRRRAGWRRRLRGSGRWRAHTAGAFRPRRVPGAPDSSWIAVCPFSLISQLTITRPALGCAVLAGTKVTMGRKGTPLGGYTRLERHAVSQRSVERQVGQQRHRDVAAHGRLDHAGAAVEEAHVERLHLLGHVLDAKLLLEERQRRLRAGGAPRRVHADAALPLCVEQVRPVLRGVGGAHLAWCCR